MQSTLDDLIKNGDAKIVKSSQFTIPNNLTDKFTTATSTPVSVDIKQADDGNQVLTTQSDKDNPLFLEKRLTVIFAPTINNLLWVKSLDNGKGMTTVFTIHDGDSILFTGYDSTMLGLDNKNHPVVFSVKAQFEK